MRMTPIETEEAQDHPVRWTIEPNDFGDWLGDAEGGAQLVYMVGNLALARHRTQRAGAQALARTAVQVGSVAWRAWEDGLVELVQRRSAELLQHTIEPGKTKPMPELEYIAVRRSVTAARRDAEAAPKFRRHRGAG